MAPLKDVNWCLRAATCCLPLPSLLVSLQTMSKSKRAALETPGLSRSVCAGCHKACLPASTACQTHTLQKQTIPCRPQAACTGRGGETGVSKTSSPGGPSQLARCVGRLLQRGQHVADGSQVQVHSHGQLALGLGAPLQVPGQVGGPCLHRLTGSIQGSAESLQGSNCSCTACHLALQLHAGKARHVRPGSLEDTNQSMGQLADMFCSSNSVGGKERCALSSSSWVAAHCSLQRQHACADLTCCRADSASLSKACCCSLLQSEPKPLGSAQALRLLTTGSWCWCLVLFVMLSACRAPPCPRVS